jgi:type II secretory pathway pseudopilin PulG
MSKGVSEITTMALYVGVALTAISGALTVGVPAIQNMQDAASIQKAQNFMQQIDSSVGEVVSEGEGSTRTLSADFDRGQLYFNNETNSLVYELKTDASVISPQATRRTGNIVLSSNADVSVHNTSVNGTPCYLMENKYIKACIKNVGSQEDQKSINTSDLLTLYEFKNPDGSNKQLDGNMTVKLNDIDSTSYGTGYTAATETGDFIGTGEVVATVASDYGFTYDIYFRLPTGSDFIKVDVQNFQ